MREGEEGGIRNDFLKKKREEWEEGRREGVERERERESEREGQKTFHTKRKS